MIASVKGQILCECACVCAILYNDLNSVGYDQNDIFLVMFGFCGESECVPVTKETTR